MTQADVGIYAAAARAAQVILLLIISVSLMFSPFVADLHARGERDKLDRLYKWLTGGPGGVPAALFVLLAVAPDSALRLFGAEFGAGRHGPQHPARGTAGERGHRHGGLHPDHGRPHRLGPGRLRGVGGARRGAGLAADPVAGHGGRGCRRRRHHGRLQPTRLYLVWRFVRIQPYDRSYLLLLLPTVAGFLAGLGVHTLLSETAGYVDLVGTAAAVVVGYGIVLLVAGLPASERRALAKLASALVRRGKATAH